MIKTLYKMWEEELGDRASNDEQIQGWIKDFVKWVDKVITPKKVGDRIGFASGRKYFKIERHK